eukprot:gnl/TRDRNA2_/TRDRNA2_40561_c0_seq1.p1 gnl/TRDRNA2_/TRDRNA2_40561_c0~~gnl/TRDRNA2_/TRDRNA2_40561_c0_seq1.p1  ORF type:complete len:428 (+),score=91.08 gnl/TRDRNA2_/TRDRNA2_40561_c0_seq1:36-1319(+)
MVALPHARQKRAMPGIAVLFVVASHAYGKEEVAGRSFFDDRASPLISTNLDATILAKAAHLRTFPSTDVSMNAAYRPAHLCRSRRPQLPLRGHPCSTAGDFALPTPLHSGYRQQSAVKALSDGAGQREAELIDGKAIAQQVRSEVKAGSDALLRDHSIVPGLAVVLVGSRKDSQTYVRMKKKAAAEVAFHSVDVDLPEDVTQEALLAEVDRLNADPKVHAILVQLPLPSHIDEATVLKRIKLEKDADGFSAMNIGNLCLRGGDTPLAVPCTPAGCIELLQRSGVQVAGKEAVVLGRSNIVGMPVAALLQSMNATVTVCHSYTNDMEGCVRRADIVVAALGRAEMVRGSWLKPGCVVIDVGINAVDDASKKLGYRLVGDVNTEEAKLVASKITPVPGGVGPMTIAMLLKNTLQLATLSVGRSECLQDK